MLDHVATLIRVTQNTDEAVAFGLAGARILAKILATGGDGGTGWWVLTLSIR